MKKHALLILALSGTAAWSVAAQETPATPPVPPVPVAPQIPPAPPAVAGRHKPRSFLGVEVGRLPAALSEQLNLPEGFGVLVEYVVPGSAAEAAGVKNNDILKSLDGQIVTSAEHLAVLVRSFSEGQEVPLVVLRKGQETKLTAKIQKRTVPGGNEEGQGGRHASSDPFDDSFEYNFQDQNSDYQRQLRTSLERSREQVNAATRRAMDESRRALDEARAQTARAFASRTDFGQARVVLRDPTGRVELRVVRGKHTLRVRDEKGETVFEGPINTPEQRKAIPASALPQVEALEREQATVFPKDADDNDED